MLPNKIPQEKETTSSAPSSPIKLAIPTFVKPQDRVLQIAPFSPIVVSLQLPNDNLPFGTYPSDR